MSPFPYCTRCKNMAILCKCKGLPRGQDIAFSWERPPGTLSSNAKLERWVTLVKAQPLACQLDAARWVADVKAQGLVDAFERLKPRLTAMARDYDLKGPDGTPLIGVFHEFGGYTEAQLRRDVEEAMAAFLDLEWSTLTNYGLAMINNAFQSCCTLHPERYPRSDPDLQKAQEAINVLMTVNELASQRIEYSLEVTLLVTGDPPHPAPGAQARG